MSLTLPPKQEFEMAPQGTHIATCYQVIDLGSQISEFNGEKKIHRKVRISWELSSELMKDGRPFSVNKTYNLSSNDKSSLVIDINAWRGKPFTTEEFGSFDLTKLLGKSCMLQVMYNESKGKTYANVKAVMALPKGQASTPLTNPAVGFSLGDFNQSVFDGLTDYLKQMIMASPEFKELKGIDDGNHGQEISEMPTEECPF